MVLKVAICWCASARRPSMRFAPISRVEERGRNQLGDVARLLASVRDAKDDQRRAAAWSGGAGRSWRKGCHCNILAERFRLRLTGFNGGRSCLDSDTSGAASIRSRRRYVVTREMPRSGSCIRASTAWFRKILFSPVPPERVTEIICLTQEPPPHEPIHWTLRDSGEMSSFRARSNERYLPGERRHRKCYFDFEPGHGLWLKW
jgi:hypothetical protein